LCASTILYHFTPIQEIQERNPMCSVQSDIHSYLQIERTRYYSFAQKNADNMII